MTDHLRIEEAGEIDGAPGVLLRGSREAVKAVAALFGEDVALCRPTPAADVVDAVAEALRAKADPGGPTTASDWKPEACTALRAARAAGWGPLATPAAEEQGNDALAMLAKGGVDDLLVRGNLLIAEKCDAALARVAVLEEALRIIAGERQCIARAALTAPQGGPHA